MKQILSFNLILYIYKKLFTVRSVATNMHKKLLIEKHDHKRSRREDEHPLVTRLMNQTKAVISPCIVR